MSNQDKERERLARLRDRQLQARNPRKTDQRVMRQVARRRGRKQKKVTFGEMVRDLPHKWRDLFLGIVIGMVIWIVLDAVADGVWVDPVGLLAILFLAILGYVLGQAFDVRDDLRRL
jgi:hypothetical protein